VRTTLRFTSLVAGLAGLVVLAAIILSANDWLSTPPGVNERIAIRTSAPAPQSSAPVPQAPASAPQPAAPEPQPVSAPQPIAAVVAPPQVAPAAVSVRQLDEQQAVRQAGHHHDRGENGGHDGGGRHGDGGGSDQDR
jgi:hypothetical protein